jgi:hypothetical protein
MWHFLLMMLAPPNACMRLALSQSSTTLASHAFSASICISFCNSFLALLFPLLWKASTDMRQILANSALCASQMQPSSVAEHKALTDDGGTVSEKEASGVWLFYCLAVNCWACRQGCSNIWSLDFRLVAIATPSHLLWCLSPPDSVHWTAIQFRPYLVLT